MKQGIKMAVMTFYLTLACGAVAQTAQNPDPYKTTANNTSQAALKWVNEDKTDPLRGNQFSQFSLEGKYLKPPRNAPAGATPAMVVRCRPGSFSFGHSHGKFLGGFIHVGSVVVDAHVEHDFVNDNLYDSVDVDYRLDDGKLHSEGWNHSEDFSSIFFEWMDFNNLLYGHTLPHKENTTPRVHKVVIGVPEYLGGEVVMQFDMPDSTDVAETCGVTWHKK